MSTLSIQTSDGRNVYAPGETIRATASWELDDNVDSVEIRLIWFTSGKGTLDLGVVEQTKFDAPPRVGKREFSFKLPVGPYSFSGRLITLSWALELIAGRATEPQRHEFVLSPFPREIDLYANEGAST